MASQTFFDLNKMLVQLEQLERREREVSKERRQLHRRIDILRSELRLLNRRPE